MRLWIARLLVVALVAVTGQIFLSSDAAACSIVAPYNVTATQLASTDLGDPGNEISQGYRSYWNAETAPQIVGGYIIETVHTLEPEGDWTRGSVSTVVQAWGQWPEATGPFKVDTVDLSEVARDSCGEPADGPKLGTRRLYLVTDASDEAWRLHFDYASEGEAVDAFTAAFGRPDIVDRDEEAEQLLLAQLGNARSGQGTGIAIAFGGILVVAGVLGYQYRKRRLFYEWDKLQAEAAEADAADSPENGA